MTGQYFISCEVQIDRVFILLQKGPIFICLQSVQSKEKRSTTKRVNIPVPIPTNRVVPSTI